MSLFKTVPVEEQELEPCEDCGCDEVVVRTDFEGRWELHEVTCAKCGTFRASYDTEADYT